MTQPRFEFTAVVNIHREGLWAHKAIRAALFALEHAYPDPGYPLCELIIIADRADAETLKIARAHPTGYIPTRVIEVDFGDLGLARNAGAQAAEGEFVGFLDGDDVWGVEWVHRAVEHLKALGDAPAAAHAHVNVGFGDGNNGIFWWTQPDAREDHFEPALFWNANHWSSLSLARRELYLAHPYARRTAGTGFEDWEWNARTLAAGVLHTAVPKTVHFIRKKHDGLNVDSARRKQLPEHSPYFELDARTHWAEAKKAFPPWPIGILKGAEPPLPVDAAWLLPQWEIAHRVEPMLWPDAATLESLPRYRAGLAKGVMELALAILGKWKAREPEREPTHVILAPCLVKGGADKRIMDYATAIAHAGGAPLVLLTDRDTDPSWAGNTPDGVHVVDAAATCKAAGLEVALLATARLLMRWATKGARIHVVNSRIGYITLANYGDAIRCSYDRLLCGPRIFCSLYGSEEHDGRLGGAAFNGWFYAAHKAIDVVLSDNARHLLELREVHGWPLERTAIAPTPTRALHPSELSVMNAQRGAGLQGMLRVLWASRMYRGKRVDRLLAVAKLAHEKRLPILFAVAGEVKDQFSVDVVKELRKLPNVKVSTKEFNGWATLAPEKHDVFMFTSQSEGMPNVVLEALGLGLRVVSTDVGDVAKTPATVVKNADDPMEWLNLIVGGAAPIRNGVAYVLANHSLTAFDAALAATGYLDQRREDAGRSEERADDGRRNEGGDDAGRARAAHVAGDVEAPPR